MIVSDCFHSNRVVPEYKYTDEFINFIIKKTIFELRCASDQKLVEVISSYYDDGVIKPSYLKKRFVEIFGDKNKGKYYATQSIDKELNIYIQLMGTIKKYRNLDSHFLYSKLTLNVDSYSTSIDATIIYLILEHRSSNIDALELSIIIFNQLVNFKTNYEKLASMISNIKKNYYVLSIYDFIDFTDLVNRLLIENSINTVEDLFKLNPYTLMYMFSNNLNYYYDIISSMNIGIKNVIDNAFRVIDEKSLYIMLRRKNYIEGNTVTLEEIGNEFNVTRERIRQLESKAAVKVRRIAADNNSILLSFYRSEIGKRKPYITLDKLLKKYDESFVCKMLLLYELGEQSIKYDSKYRVLYDSGLNNLDEMINDIIYKIGIVAEPSEIEKTDYFAMNVIENNYREIGENLYLKNGCANRELYLDLIEELFPTGFRAGDDSEYLKFINIVKERYKIVDDLPSKRALEGMLERGDFVIIDSGVFLAQKYTPVLGKELLDNILNYISENEFTYYNTIYEMYEKELNRIGITNRYYLKGCLDRFLDESMITKRDYIICGKTSSEPRDIIINKMRSYEKAFSIEDLRNEFKGIKDYTFYRYLYDECSNGLIWISSNNFIYSDKYKIDKEVIQELETFVDEIFKLTGSDVLTSKKIYAKIQMTNKPLFEKLHLSNGNFELFSILKSFVTKYFYSRPYVYLSETDNTTRSLIVENYVKKFDTFNYKMITDYQSKLNISVLSSYLNFMDSMCDEYVQVDVDEMVRKEKINLKESDLNKIKNVIDLLLDNFGEINTQKFNVYSLFPKVSYVWNKYLLSGIVKSFFSEYYDVINTENRYDSTDYIIRRI